MSLCLATGALVVALNASEITLSWVHSVQKTNWEEVWRAEASGVWLVEARIQGAGAGMEAPPEAKLMDGYWRWHPAIPPLPEVVLRRSGATADWRVCIAARCRTMSELLPADADPVVLKACP
jgi:hypothetical protein